MTDPFYAADRGSSVSFGSGGAGGDSFKTKRWLLGPFGEFNLGHGFAIEGDAIYHRLNYDSFLILISHSAGLYYSFSSTAASDWEFPVLVKYRLSGYRTRPFQQVVLRLTILAVCMWPQTRAGAPMPFLLSPFTRSAAMSRICIILQSGSSPASVLNFA